MGTLYQPPLLWAFSAIEAVVRNLRQASYAGPKPVSATLPRAQTARSVPARILRRPPHQSDFMPNGDLGVGKYRVAESRSPACPRTSGASKFTIGEYTDGVLGVDLALLAKNCVAEGMEARPIMAWCSTEHPYSVLRHLSWFQLSFAFSWATATHMQPSLAPDYCINE